MSGSTYPGSPAPQSLQGGAATISPAAYSVCMVPAQVCHTSERPDRKEGLLEEPASPAESREVMTLEHSLKHTKFSLRD